MLLADYIWIKVFFQICVLTEVFVAQAALHVLLNCHYVTDMSSLYDLTV